MIVRARAAQPARPVLRPPWRRLGALLLVVTAAHLWLTAEVLQDTLGAGAEPTRPRRIEVAFVRELKQESPPSLTPPPAPPRAARASMPVQAASAPAPLPDVLALPELSATPLPPPPEAYPAAAVAVEETGAVPAAPTVAAFEWPPSTRLSYQLTGHYRGPVEGQARVEWLRSGGRYQVHLEVSIGPSFAPLLARRMSSDGELSASGLRPRRYDEETRVALRSPRRVSITFDDERVRLPSGTEVPLPPGVQDTASQFVQMTWMFTTRPELLEVGRTIEMPLALPRRVDLWLYDVLARETLATAMGPIETVHVKPRRDAGAPGAGGELSAEMWVAPTLQYLPVRILIRQDRDTYVDLLIERLPQQAGDPVAASAPPRSLPPLATR